MSNVADAQKIFSDNRHYPDTVFEPFKDDGKTLRCRAVIWCSMTRSGWKSDRQCTHAATFDIKRGKLTHCHTHSDNHVDDKIADRIVWDLSRILKIDEAEAKKLVKKYGPV